MQASPGLPFTAIRPVLVANVPIQASKDDLAAVVRASKSPDASLVFKGKLRFAMDRESLGALVEDLATERYSLGKLVRRVKTKREWEASEPTSSSVALTVAFSRVRESATSLYWAACRCWVCDQHRLHTLMIRLEHRIPSRAAASSSAVTFRLCFPIEEAVLQRIEVAIPCGDSLTAKTVVKFQNEEVSPSGLARYSTGIANPKAVLCPWPSTAALKSP